MLMSARCALQTNSCLSCILALDIECILSRIMQAAMIDFHACLVLVSDVHEQEVAALRNEVAAENDEVNKLHTGDLPADVLAKYAKASSSTVLDFNELFS